MSTTVVAQWVARSAGRCPLHGLQEGRSVGGYPPQGLRAGLLRGVYGGIRPIAPIRPITPTTCPVLARVGIGLIGAIGLIGLIGLEAWTDGLCAGYLSSRSVVFVPFRAILPVGKRRHVYSLSRGGVCGCIYYIGVIVGW